MIISNQNIVLHNVSLKNKKISCYHTHSFFAPGKGSISGLVRLIPYQPRFGPNPCGLAGVCPTRVPSRATKKIAFVSSLSGSHPELFTPNPARSMGELNI
jgi:hypothetical protein